MLLFNISLSLMGVLTICLVAASGEDDSYVYWSHKDIHLTKLFEIDHSNQRIVLAAKNSVCHLTLDLQYASNIQNTTPTDSEINHCETDSSIFKSWEQCQNFHHILHFPNDNGQLVLPNNKTIPLNETVLICGSNAYQPKCTYRYRTNLTAITYYSGENVCPFDSETVAASIISRNGSLLSATSLNVKVNKHGFTLSNSPFTGETAIRTIDRSLMFNKPIFVDLYERGDYYYIFFREIAEEESPSPIYSRVARVCKNDAGIVDPNAVEGYNVFTTYIKARIICTTTVKSTNDFPYTYNDIMDTVYIKNGTIDSTLYGDYMYAIFNSPENGPAGSALCVYTFDNQMDNDLTNVFSKPFLVRTDVNRWEERPNDTPICPGRTYGNATNNVLMKPAVSQVNQPLLQEDSLLYQKLLVDQVVGYDGIKYDVLLIVATSQDNLHFFKRTYVSSRGGNDKVHTSQSVTLERNSSNGANQEVGKMELYKNENDVSVYISTSEGLYTLSLTNCSRFSSCSDCVSSRDPYCAYDVNEKKCVIASLSQTGTLLQDIVNGDDSMCPVILSSSVSQPISTVTSTPPTIIATQIMISSTTTITLITTTTSIQEIVASTTKIDIIPSRAIVTSSTKDVLATKEESSSIPLRTIKIEPSVNNVSEINPEDHTWTYVAGGGGLTIGIVIGLILFALMKNKDKFCWGKFFSRRRRYNYNDDEGQNKYEMTYYKVDRNNAEYSKGFQRSSTPPLSKNQPPSNVIDKVQESPVLSKYTSTGNKTHNRSLSSGGPIVLPFSLPNPTSSPLSSPMGPNLRKTFHVEEPVKNTERQKYGKNVVGRQLSKEYPMNSTGSFHMKTSSLDLEYDLRTYKNSIFES